MTLDMNMGDLQISRDHTVSHLASTQPRVQRQAYTDGQKPKRARTTGQVQAKDLDPPSTHKTRAPG